MKILLAIDASPFSEAAVNEIAARPWPRGTLVRVLSVIQPYPPPATEFVLAGTTLEDTRRQQATDAQAVTTRAAETIRTSGLAAETAVREGDPRTMIIDEAEQWDADLIVVGSHGRTGVTRWLLGSVAQAVVAHAGCSVEVVRTRTTAAGA